jgi:hypothetical protein
MRNYSSQVADLKLQTSQKIAIAELRLRSNISLKSCGIAIAEVLLSSCGIAIADSKKSCACPPLDISDMKSNIDADLWPYATMEDKRG